MYFCLCFATQNLTSEGAVSHNVLNYQQLSIARYQVIFMLTIILSHYQKCAFKFQHNGKNYFNMCVDRLHCFSQMFFLRLVQSMNPSKMRTLNVYCTRT